MVVLGSTGSIGTNTLNLARKFGLSVEAMSCASNYELLNEQIAEFKPKFVCIAEPKFAKLVKHKRVFAGAQGICDMLKECESERVVNSLVGFAGLAPSLVAQKLGKKLALANKESLVAGGKFLNTSAIDPIDSEHFGLKFLLANKTPVARLVITASGGAFYKTPLKALKDARAADALKHPNWSMGAKITIDSATMANKLFEVLEAFWLYGVRDIEALIERTSTVHALVEFADGSTTAHLSKTDMILAIAHAILGKDGALNLSAADVQIVPNLDLKTLKNIKFGEINLKKYPIFSLKDQALQNPDLGVAINAANEVAVHKFLRGECGFLDISRTVLAAAKRFGDEKIESESRIFEVDAEVRAWAEKSLK